jgi:hypothetical protein
LDRTELLSIFNKPEVIDAVQIRGGSCISSSKSSVALKKVNSWRLSTLRKISNSSYGIYIIVMSKIADSTTPNSARRGLHDLAAGVCAGVVGTAFGSFPESVFLMKIMFPLYCANVF